MPRDGEQLALKGFERYRRPSTEFKLQCALANLIRRCINPGWKFTALPMGEHRTAATAARLKAMGVTPGWPDLMFVGPGHSVLFIELKRRGGRLSDEQIAIRAHLMRCGFMYLVTDSFDDAVSALQDYSILPRGIHVQ